MLRQLAVGLGVRAALVSVVLVAAACSGGGDTERTSSVEQALTFAVPFRVRAIDFTAFNDSDTVHEGTCGSGPVDQQTVSDNGATCGIAYTKPGEWLEYSIQVATAGKFDLVSRVAGNATGKTIRLSIDGVAVGGSQSVPSAGWTAFADRAVNDVSLTAGSHTLRVLFETGDTNFNYIDITPGTVALPQRIEAENYQRALESTPASNSGTGCNRGDGVDKDPTTDQSGGCLVGWATAGEWLEYDVTVPQSGLFDFTARLASATAGRTLQLSVDGTSIGTVTSPNAGYTAFDDRKLQNVSLSAGAHVIRATFVQGDLNLNYIDISAHPFVVGYSFGGSVNYNALVFQDLSVAPSVAGPLAAGRDISSQGFSYNTLAAGTIGALAGRNFTGTSGNVQRDLVYGNTVSLNNVTVSQGVSRKAAPIDFVAEKATLDLLTTNLANFTANGTTTISPSGTIFTFTGTDPSRNIFSVAGAGLAAGDQFNFSVPATSTVIVNVTGTTAAFDTASINLGSLTPGHLVWNFPQSTTLRVTSAGFKGTLLGVNAAATMSSASLDGVLLAGSISGSNTGITWQPFNGSLTVCSGAALSIAPASPQLVGASLALSASATCADSRAGEFHYDYLNSGTETTWHEVAPGFSTGAVNWNTSALPAGTYQVRVQVRRVGEASLSGASATSSFILDNPVLIPTAAPTVETFASLGISDVSPQPAGWRIDKQVNPRTVGSFTAATFKTDFRAGASLPTASLNGIYNFGAGVANAQAANYWLNSSDRAPGWLSAGSTVATGGTKSGNLYVALVAPTDKDITGLDIGYDIEKYGNGTNPAGFRIQLYSSPDGTTWTNVGPDFLRSFPANANNLGFDPAPGLTTNFIPKRLTTNIPRNTRFYLAWNYTVDSPTSNDGSNAQALALDNVSIQGSDVCVPNCIGKVCGGDMSNGCGGTCTGLCGGGQSGCLSDANCGANLHCVSRSPAPGAARVCVPLTCTAECTAECPCTSGSGCLTDSQCGVGFTCPNGVCVNSSTACVPSCAGKVCGDDPNDGCGGNCALCDVHQGECQRDTDCGPGLVCGKGAAARFGLTGVTNACWSAVCEGTDPAQIPCGTTTSTCGTCAVCQPNCTGKDYGPDGCGGSCGFCGMFQFEGPDGKCLSSLSTPLGNKPPNFVPLSDYVTQPSGKVDGTFSVSNTGQAQYSVPLVLPPGRNSMMPFLSIVYNSAAGNGDLGMGWSLSGLSKITNCPQTIAQDGRANGIRDVQTKNGTAGPVDSDTRCLDGMRLIQLTNKTSSGQKQYLTEIDTGVKVVTVSATDTDGFLAYYPDGRIATFKQPDSNLLLTIGQSSNGDGSGSFEMAPATDGIWAVSRVEDRSGNYLTVDYDVTKFATSPTPWGLQILPKNIWYAGNNDGTKADTHIEFDYDLRSDIFESYRAGIPFRHDQILKTISISVGELPVRAYHLDYLPYGEDILYPDKGANRLTALSECVPDSQGSSTEVCKPATTFAYGTDLGSDSNSSYSSPAGFNPFPRQIGYHPNAPGSARYDVIPDTVLDMNGDGVDDLLMVVLNAPPGSADPFGLDKHFELLLNGRGDSIKSGNSTDASNLAVPADVVNIPTIYNVVDYDADGRDDLLMETSAGTGNYKALTFKDDTGLTVVDLGIPSSTPAPTIGTVAHRTYILDADGDGIRDIIKCTSDTTSGNAPWTWTFIHVPDMTVRPLDYNGGCFDHYIAADLTGGGRQSLLIQDWRYLAPGGSSVPAEIKNFYLAVSFDNAEASNAGSPDAPTPVHISSVLTTVPVDTHNGLAGHPLDANGDGLIDILIYFSSGQLMTCMGTGIATLPFECSPQFNYIDGYLKTGAQGQGVLLTAAGAGFVLGPVIDVNGDGRDDLLIATPGELAWRVLKSVTVPASDPQSKYFSSGWRLGTPAQFGAPPTTWDGNVLTGRGYAMDVNGDGIKDFVQKPTGGFGPGYLAAYIRGGAYGQKLTKIGRANWNNPVTQIAYANASAPTTRPDDSDPLSQDFTPQVYQRDSGPCDYGSGLFCPAPRQAVVMQDWEFYGHDSEVTETNGKDRVFGHEYTGQRIGINGRGNLGFSSHLVSELRATFGSGLGNSSVKSTFDNITRDPTTGIFPYAGREVDHLSVTPVDSGDMSLALSIEKSVQFAFQANPSTGAVITPFAQVTTETTQYLNADIHDFDPAVATVTHTVQIDDYGNQTSVSSDWSGGGRNEHESLTTTFAHETRSQFVDDWLVHLPATRVVTSSGIAGESQQGAVTRITAFTYYDTGLLKDTTIEPNTAMYTVSTHFERDDYGNVWKAQSCKGKPPCTDPNTRTTSTVYDERNVFPLTTTDAEGYVTKTDHDLGLGVITQTDQHGRAGTKVLSTYSITDGFGRVRVSIAPDGRTTKISYDSTAAGLLGVTTKEDGGPTNYYNYDALGRETHRETAALDGHDLDAYTEYTELGMVDSRTRLGDSQNSAVQYYYDGLGRPTETTEPGGASSSNCYDGNITCVIDAKKNGGERDARCVEKDHRGRTIFAADPVPLIGEQGCVDVARTLSATATSARVGIAYKYGPFSRLETATRRPEGKVVAEQSYDRLGRVASKTTSGGTKTYSYNPFGQLETVTDANAVKTLEYDNLGRPRFQTVDPIASGDPNTHAEWSWRDDFQGRLDFDSVDDGPKTTLDYDAKGRLKTSTSTIAGEDFVSSIDQYDSHGRPQIISYPGDADFKVENVYDDNTGILQEVKQVLPSSSPPGAAISYWKLNTVDQNGLLKTETFGNGQVTTHTYDPQTGVPSTLVTAVPHHDPVQNLSYTFWDDRNLKTLNDDVAGTSQGFTYDAFGRIDQVDEGQDLVSDFDYTSFGSIKTNAKGWAYTYDPAAPESVHSIRNGADTSTFQYDPTTGALTHRSAGVLSELNVEYTAAQKPKKVWGDDASLATTYDYDANQSKVAKHGPTGSTTYIGNLYYREVNSTTGDSTHHYLISNGRGAIAEVLRTVPSDGGGGSGDSKTLYLHADHLGSISVVTDSDGAVVDRRKFSIFGEDEATTPATSQVGYTGHWQEPEHGLIDMGGRFYDPAVGQFLSSDPFGGSLLLSESFNLRAYVGNKPLRFTDPSGFAGCDELSNNCGGDSGGTFSLDYGPYAEGTGNSFNTPAANEPGYSTGSSFPNGTGPNAALSLGDKVMLMGIGGGAALGAGAGTSYVLAQGAAWLCIGSGACAAVVIAGVTVGLTGYVVYDLVWNGGAAKIATAFTRFETAGDALTVGATVAGVGALARGPLTNVISRQFGSDAAADLLGGGGPSGPWVPKGVRPGGAVAQSLPGSCGAACAEMLSEGALTEGEVVGQIGEWTTPDQVAASLGEEWTGGFFESGADALTVARSGTTAGLLWAPGMRAGHFVVIEATEGGFLIRDPLPGVNYTVNSSWIQRWVAGGVWK